MIPTYLAFSLATNLALYLWYLHARRKRREERRKRWMVAE